MSCSLCKLVLVAALLTPVSALAQGGSSAGGAGGGSVGGASSGGAAAGAASSPAGAHGVGSAGARSAHQDRPMLEAPATIRAAQETQRSRSIRPAQTPLERPILRDQRPAAEARQSVRRRSELRATLQAERRAVALTVL
jgi:hypothetical protein